MEIKSLVLHHSALNSLEFPEQFNIINNGHKFRNWGTKSNPIYAGNSSLGFYIQYHYFIEKNGEVKKGRTEKEVGWHSGNREVNNSSISICLAGNFDIELPTKEQEASLTELLKELKLRYSEAEIKYHRDIKPTHCPGLKIKDDWAKDLISNNKKMRYVISEKKNQYLLYDELKIALEIGDEEELKKLNTRGLEGQPKEVSNSYLDEFEIYPLFTKKRGAEEIKKLRDILGL